MNFGQIIFPFGVAAFFYLIAALQIGGLYRTSEEQWREEFSRLVTPFVLLLLSMALTIISIYFFALIGIVSAWCGLYIRRIIRDRTKGPLPWLLTPLTIGVMNRWPMLLFDVWTLGLAGAMGLVIFVGSN